MGFYRGPKHKQKNPNAINVHMPKLYLPKPKPIKIYRGPKHRQRDPNAINIPDPTRHIRTPRVKPLKIPILPKTNFVVKSSPLKTNVAPPTQF